MSQVKGDIAPKIVTLYHDLLALPLTHIYNRVFEVFVWPEIWVNETVIIIPKNSSL